MECPQRGSAKTIGFTNRLADEAGAQPSIGSIGDALDNARGETTIGLYKTELIGNTDHGKESIKLNYSH